MSDSNCCGCQYATPPWWVTMGYVPPHQNQPVPFQPPNPYPPFPPPFYSGQQPLPAPPFPVPTPVPFPLPLPGVNGQGSPVIPSPPIPFPPIPLPPLPFNPFSGLSGAVGNVLGML